ncbi:vacuolar protein sorting-associated protein 18 homolog [Ciona intestinalis]
MKIHFIPGRSFHSIFVFNAESNLCLAMSSILDQYEATMSHGTIPDRQRSVHSNSASSPVEPVASGYISATEDQTPIFNKSKINFKPQEPITHLSICNNMLCMVMAGRLLLRINLMHPDNVDEVEITRGDEKVYKLHFDPTGRFVLLTLTSEETIFLSPNSRKPKSLHKFKGHKIESVGWCHTATGNTTGAVLVGTSWGLIMECSIEAGEDTKFFGGSVDQYFKQVYKFASSNGRGDPVTGLEYFCTASKQDGKNDYCIFAATPNKLYQFSGTMSPNSGEVPVFQAVFSLYINTPPRHIQIPGIRDNSQLILLYSSKGSTVPVPTQFAWMTAEGVYIGEIKLPSMVETSTSIQQRSLITNARLVHYPDTAADNTNPFADNSGEVLNIVLTEFHLLLLYSDRLKVICSLNEQLIFEDVYSSRYGQLRGLVKDPAQGTIWTYTDGAVFKYKVVKESRDVWQMYLDMGKFDLAREHCRDNPANLDKVLTRQAEHEFSKGQYQESALYYAITQNCFEDVALKFLRAGKEVALRAYLQKKLSNLKAGETTQMTMLSTWLVELYLNQIGKLSEAHRESQELNKCRENLKNLLAQVKLKECFQENRNTIYDLLISHSDIEDYVFFAVLMQDYERVVNHHIQNEDYTSALDALRKQNSVPLYYKFSPVLMQHIPQTTVNAWIQLGRRIDPRHIIPSLVNCTERGSETHWMEAIRYLEFCTTELECSDPAIHNYLLSLYAKHVPNSVISYLRGQGDDSSEICYDVKYALRLCLGNKDPSARDTLHQACVHIYTVMALYEEAVNMALKVDVELAKSIADRRELEEDEETRRKLWLCIAKHIVQEDKDIKRAMKFLQESGDLLKIEDILPFFPDFVTIDHFKDALCESLAEYNKHIDQLKDEMNEATSSAHSIRANIQETRNRHLVVGGTDRCKSCDKLLLTRAFYLFPCQHAFHNDCMWKDARPLLIDSKRDLADRLQQKLLTLNLSNDSTSKEERKTSRQKLIKDLDETIANECVLCGEIAVRSIDTPFLDETFGGEETWS